MEKPTMTITAATPTQPRPPFDLEAALREVSRGCDLASELHSLLRELIPRGDGRLESAYSLSKDLQQTLASALSILKPRRARFRAASDPLALEISLPSTAADAPPPTVPPHRDDIHGGNHHHTQKISPKKRNLQSITVAHETCHEETQCCKANGERKISKGKLHRNHLHSWTTITCTPFNDGHQWRKYGEKKISQCPMPRCYYRCTHKDDQGCPATKQVQQRDSEDPPTFIVTYNKQHTCRSRSLLYGEQFIIESSITDPCQLSL